MPVRLTPAAIPQHGGCIEGMTVRKSIRKLSSGATSASKANLMEEIREEGIASYEGLASYFAVSRGSSPGIGSDEGRIDEELLKLRRWLESTKIGHNIVSSRNSELLSPTDSGPHTPPDSTDHQSIQVKGKAKELNGFAVPHSVLHDATEPDLALLSTPQLDSPQEMTASGIAVPTIANSEDDDELAEDVQVLPSLTAADVQFTVEDSQKNPPTLKQLRERIIKQYPQLVAAPEPVVKPRKAHEPPPAVDTAVRARFKQTPQAEKEARELSLVLHVDEETELSVIRGIVVLESRQGRWDKLADEATASPSAFDIPELSKLPTMPSAWLLPVDTAKLSAQHKIKSRKTFELPDYRVVVPCWECHGEASLSCHACAGVAADECFWCESSGKRNGSTCEGCNGQGVNQCRTCSNTGRLPCTFCDSTGKLQATYVVDVKLRTIELPPLRVDSLVNPHMPGPPPCQDDIMECARAKMAASVSRLFEEQAGKPVPAVPVLARCIWSKTTQRVVSVWRPYQIPKSIRRRMSAADKPGKVSSAPTDEDASAPSITEGFGSDRNGELRRFIVPCDLQAPVVELHHDARAHSTNYSPRNSTVISTASGSAVPSPANSLMHVGMLWRNSVSRSRSGSEASPMEQTPASSVPPSPALSPHGSVILVAPPTATAASELTSTRPRPEMLRLSTAPVAGASSMPPSPLRLSHDSGIKAPANSPVKRLRSASIAALIPRRRSKSVPEDAAANGGTPRPQPHLPVPAPLTPAGPVTWSRRKSSAVAPSSLAA